MSVNAIITNQVTGSIDNTINMPVSKKITEVCKDFFLYIPNQLIELDITGRSSLFHFTKALLINEADSRIKKTMKISCCVLPIIPAVIITTFVVDNIFKLFKENKLDKLEKEYDETISMYLKKIEAKRTNVLTKYRSSDFRKIEKGMHEVTLYNEKAQQDLKILKDQFFSKLAQNRTLSFQLDSSSKDLTILKDLISREENKIKDIVQSIKYCDNIWKVDYKKKLHHIGVIHKKILEEINNSNPNPCEHFYRITSFDILRSNFLGRIQTYSDEFEKVKEEIINKVPDTEISGNSGDPSIYETEQFQQLISEINFHLCELQHLCEFTLKKERLSTLATQEDSVDKLGRAKHWLKKYEKTFPFEEKAKVCEFIKNHNAYIQSITNKLIYLPNYTEVTTNDCLEYRSMIQSLITQTNDKLNLLKTLPANHYLKERYLRSLEEKKQRGIFTDAKLREIIDELSPFEENLTGYKRRLNSYKSFGQEPVLLERSYKELTQKYQDCRNVLKGNSLGLEA